MPRVAFMVLCHQQPELVRMLAERLLHADCTTVVHVDKGIPSVPFQQAVAQVAGVAFVPNTDRVAVHWAGFSMVEATLAAIQHALAVAPQTERFVLLSGSDCPVYPVDVILERMSGTDEFIRVDRKLDPDGSSWFDTCANRTFLGDFPATNPRKLTGPTGNIVRKVEQRLKRRTPYGRAVFYGPSWWSLTRPAIDYILDLHRTAPETIEWFRWARSPDEMAFQTLVKASPFADRIRHDATRTGGATWPVDLAGVHYARFEDGSASPKTLGMDDLPAIHASGALFARKVDAVQSGALLQAIG